MTTGAEHGTLAALALGWLGKLPQWAQVAALVAAIFTAGGGVALAAVNFRGLPSRVVALEAQSLQNDSMHVALDTRVNAIERGAAIDRARIESKIDRVICLQEAAAGRREYASCAR